MLQEFFHQQQFFWYGSVSFKLSPEVVRQITNAPQRKQILLYPDAGWVGWYCHRVLVIFFIFLIDVKSNPYILIFGRRIDLDTSFYPTTARFLTITTSAADLAGKVLLKTELKCRLKSLIMVVQKSVKNTFTLFFDAESIS